jgi:hypothetical protein
VQNQPIQQFFKSISTIPVEMGAATKTASKRNTQTGAAPTVQAGWYEYRNETFRKIGKAATLVMLQLPTPARELIAWIHVPSQPLM